MENSELNVTALQADRKAELEPLVLAGLEIARECVRDANPAQPTITIPYSVGDDKRFAPTGWVMEEIGRRIQKLSPDWKVKVYTYGGETIKLERLEPQTEQSDTTAGAFNVSEALAARRAELEGLVLEGLERARQQVAKMSPCDLCIDVILADEKKFAPTPWVVQEIARRIQRLSPGWTVKAYIMGGERVHISRNKTAVEISESVEGGFDVSGSIKAS